MRKQEKIIGAGIIITACATIGILSFSDSNGAIRNVFASESPYGLTVNASKAAISGTSGSFDMTTTSGNTVAFAYKDASETGSVIALDSLGYIKNTSALTDLDSLTATYTDSDSGLYVSYGWKNDSGAITYAVENAKLTSGTAFSFAGDHPDFVKVSAIRALTINSLQFTYECSGGISSTKASYFADEANYQTIVNASSTTLTNQEAAYVIAHAARREGASALASTLLANAGLTSSSSSTLTQATAVQMLYQGFNGTLPSQVGARKFEAYDSSSTLSSLSSSAAYYKGAAMLSNAGLLAPLTSSSTTVFSATTTLDKAGLSVLTKRLHSYYGLSLKDDFYSTVNHDYLYEKCNDYDTASTGTASDSQLIPDSKIASWVDSKFDSVSSATTTAATKVNNFLSTAFESGGHAAGTASTSLAGLGSTVSSIMSATTASGMKTIYKNMLSANGWCPLWDELTSTWLQGSSAYYFGLVGTPFNIYSSDHTYSDYASGATYRSQIEAKFTTRFTAIFGNATTAATYASYYGQWCYLWYKAVATSYTSYISTAKAVSTSSTVKSLINSCTGISATSLGYFYFYNYGALQATAFIFTDTNINYIKAYTLVETFIHNWQCLPNDAATTWFGEGTTRTGLQNKPGYFTTYFSPYVENDLCNWYATTTEYATKESAVASVFNNIKTYMNTRFANSSWLSSTGKTSAEDKLKAIDYNLMMSYGITSTSGSLTSSGTLSYTSYSYTSLSSGGTLYKNMGIHDLPIWTGLKSKIGTTYSSSSSTWDTYVRDACSPLYANAFYSPYYNGFNITMGYFAAYSDVDTMDLANKLASYGWVIGHEITHGFDSTGSQYDASGTKTSIFGSDDSTAFASKTALVTAAYTGPEVMPGCFTDGSEKDSSSETDAGVLTEATADLGGLAVSLDIGAALEGSNFDYEAFFIRGAKNFSDYCSRYVYSAYGLDTDEHPVGKIRVNQGYEAFDVFNDTYGISSGDAMYVADNDYYVW